MARSPAAPSTASQMAAQNQLIPFTVLTANHSHSTHAVLSVNPVSSANKTFSRVNVRVTGEGTRYWGTRNLDAVESARNLLSRISDRISAAELKRVLEVVQDAPGSSTRGSQPSSSPCVSIIHQIYGVFRDGKPMSRLFENSLQRWRHLAKQMGARHHLWSADEVDALIKQKYAQLWPTYCDVPFSIMRADIGRIAILHSFGGMYVDLDVYPNRNTYAPCTLAVQKVYTTGYRTAMKKRSSAKRQHDVVLKSDVLDMEVLIASQGNPILLQWLNYIRRQIEVKNYADSKFWKIAKMRYIHHTTGPKCMARFLRLQENQEVLRKLKFLSCNNFAHGRDLSMNEKRMFDVLSFESNSYYGERDAFKSLVGDGQGPVPVLDGSQPSLLLCRRFSVKRKINESDIVKNRPDAKKPAIDSNQGPPVADGSADSQTRSLDDHKVRVAKHLWAGARGPSKKKPKKVLQSAAAAAAPSSDMALRKTAPARNIRRWSKSSLSSAAGSKKKKKSTTTQGAQTTEKNFRDQWTQTELAATNVDFYVNEMRFHLHKYSNANCVATIVFLQDLPEHVRTFFTVLPRQSS